MKVLTPINFTAVFLTALHPGAPAHAYLDPGTGSMMLQLLLGGIAGALMVLRLYWYRIKNSRLFRGWANKGVKEKSEHGR